MTSTQSHVAYNDDALLDTAGHMVSGQERGTNGKPHQHHSRTLLPRECVRSCVCVCACVFVFVRVCACVMFPTYQYAGRQPTPEKRYISTRAGASAGWGGSHRMCDRFYTSARCMHSTNTKTSSACMRRIHARMQQWKHTHHGDRRPSVHSELQVTEHYRVWPRRVAEPDSPDAARSSTAGRRTRGVTQWVRGVSERVRGGGYHLLHDHLSLSLSR